MESLATLWKPAFLGILEGLTEFVPVSSTGHLIVASHFLGYGSPEFEIIIQLGAMFALTWCTKERILELSGVRFSGGLGMRPEGRAFLARVLVAFLPAALVGFLMHDLVETYLFRPSFVALMLVVGGVLILLIDGPNRRGGIADVEHMSFAQAIAIGIGQCLSLLPGVSRSGATILTGLVAGLSRAAATEFSFFLALPTMYAAGLYTVWKARDRLADELGLGMLVGLLAAYVSSLIVIRAFLRFVQTNSLRPFGWYRIVFGLFLLAFFLIPH
ncbi:MAG: undecaprenyl-diphosphate phosphatase [Deltaproteobacteria bacterium]|nr:undecaprenyl-diphosphate phosphatase [Deltaproteobacteria bacterium]